ncbi:solute carrier family 13 (sodium-dependent dicarboxylate transporter), member 2/3/5 [Cyclobacterium xiamenense]|uniref:Solute carrier family 13 (Sodium-dependent dicarboxylate transporter), member 2/3/5 n=1 Tax=Cyclobacterium xiamenense TaxID=1297121 RepID=A0A1H7AQ36_9BACT|nr:DASS family sodium-coupled anion symporter [Cyclobacterium xiamenense]SEJ67679.1 solute carrier family 13 (sodium-dependent dicarboxylate transporter), member 2/3/5 [Cyclobacterium xiamenense]
MNKSKSVREVSTTSNVGLFLGPVLFALIMGSESFGAGELGDAGRVLALAVWMLCWWVTEAVPIPVTALLPMILLPLLGIFSMSEATAPYSNPVIYLFMGGFIIALAMERNKLHLRIALNLIRITGTRPDGIILGFFLATMFLSMWISNTATAVMMLPIALSILQLMQATNPGLERKKGFRNFAFALMLGIAYAANIGGVITIIGTPPNVVLVGYMQELYGVSLDFSRWLLVGLPIGLVMGALMYLFLVKVAYPNRLGPIAGSAEMIQDQLDTLGPIRSAEIRTTGVLVFTALLWIFRNPLNNVLPNPFLNDTIIAMVGGLLVFLIPATRLQGRKLLDWKSMERLPWGILLLFGGGMSLAKGMEVVGIIQEIGSYISENQWFSVALLVLALTAVSLFLTEVMSNVALVTIFLPVVMGIADGLGASVLVFAIPVTMASSFAFMLPISTPPNAILFSSGYIGIKDMMKAGVVLNFLAILLLWAAAYSLISWVYMP